MDDTDWLAVKLGDIEDCIACRHPARLSIACRVLAGWLRSSAPERYRSVIQQLQQAERAAFLGDLASAAEHYATARVGVAEVWAAHATADAER